MACVYENSYMRIRKISLFDLTSAAFIYYLSADYAYKEI